MRETSLLPVLVVCLLYCVGRSLSAPGRSADEVLIGEVDIAMHDDDDGGGGGGGAGGGVVGSSDDDSPEVTTEEAFAKECIVDNKAYAHSQMIPSHDQSSHCLCVAGEVYCWWQTYGVPISFSSSSSSTFKSSSFDESNDVDSWTTEEDDYSVEGPSESPEAESSGESSGEQLDDNSEELEDDDDNEAAEIESNDIPVEMRSNKNSTAKITTTTTTTTTTSTMATMTSVRPTQRVPTTCLVMGRTYQVGEALPHSTGNCVECSCGSEGRIECSPKDCVGLRPQNPGGGDLELFELERDGTF